MPTFEIVIPVSRKRNFPEKMPFKALRARQLHTYPQFLPDNNIFINKTDLRPILGTSKNTAATSLIVI